MNLGVISRNVGIALISTAAFMFLSAVVAALNGFDSSFSPLVFSGIITALIGVFPLIFVRRKQDISTKEGLAILVLSWTLCCIFAMLPYVLWGGEFTVENAWFESASGITTTGATVLRDIEALPNGLLFWRSSTHYIGGLGVVAFIIMILPSMGSIRLRMSKIDLEDISRDNYSYKSGQFIRVVVTVYLSLTAAAFVCLMLAGMTPFDAINHAFSVAATGGFSTKNASVAAYDSPLIEGILIIFMFLSSLHYGLLYASFATRSPKVFRNPVTRFYVSTIVSYTIFITLSLLVSGVETGFFQSVRQSVFAVVSTISTTGFSITDTNSWPVFSIIILLCAAVQCGCSGSTTSGVRSDRIWILAKASGAQLLRMAHPNAVVRVKTDGHVIDSDIFTSVAVYVLLYLELALIGAIVYSGLGIDFLTSVSVSISMMSNVGPCFGEFGSSMSTFADAGVVAKILMGLEMIVGRLGVFSMLSIFVFLRKDT